jgi:hypothetical protein
MFYQRSGSVRFWYGSGFVDPYHWIADPDPGLFFSDFQDTNKKVFFTYFLYQSSKTTCYYEITIRIRAKHYGVGSGSPKKLRILRIQIRIRNKVFYIRI